MVLRILMANQWKRPVYFAMTVSTENKMGLDPFLRMDGLAFRVMPYRVQNLDTELIRTNLLEKFQFRNLNNEKVYYNPNILKLLQNYRSAFMELTRQYVEDGQQEEAHYVLSEMEKRMPERIIPYADERHAVVVSNLYQLAGGEADVENRVQYTIPGKVMDIQDRMALGSWYAQFFQDWDRAEEIFSEVLEENPGEVQAVSGLFQMYRMSRQYEKAIILLENWLMQHPRDRGAEAELENLRRLVAQDTTASMQGDQNE
jgi:tetratricopeptide (TPR) repeat protein